MFFQPFHAGFIFPGFSLCFLWKMEPVCSVYTAGWKTRPPDCKYKHGVRFLGPVLFHSHRKHVNESLFRFAQNRTLCVFNLLLLMKFLEMVSSRHLFLWHGNLEAIQMSRSFILLFIRSRAFCVVRKRHRPILHFMTYCVRGGPRQTGGSPNVSSSWTRLTKSRTQSLIRRSGLPQCWDWPQCLVFLVVRWQL